jgi:hypothetical protein
MNQIDISKLDQAEVLAALYNASKQLGMGFAHARGRDGMTVPQAQEEIDQISSVDGRNLYFDYLHGRVLKINLGKDILHTHLYDRDNGPGAALRALQPLLDKQ